MSASAPRCSGRADDAPGRDRAVSFEAIIFDFDGVIVDSEMVANRALAEALTGLGSPTTAEEAIRRYSGRRWSDCLPLVEEQLGRAVPDDFVATLVADAVARLSAELRAIDGVADFVARQAHRRRAIASSSSRDWLATCLARFDLAHHFGEHVYSAEGLERGKPHPDVYLMVADRLGIDPARALVVEDSAMGVAAGAAAGMTVIGFLAGSHICDGHGERLRAEGAHHVAADYADLERIVAALDAR